MADEESVFGGSDCNLPPVTPVPSAHMLVNPLVPEPPDDIPDCDDQPLDPLPEDPPCPPLVVSNATITIIPPELPPTVTFTITRGPNCDYDFDLNIELPDTGCPTITPITPTPTTKSVTFNPTPQVSFAFTKDPVNCDFDFDLDISVPCPPLTPITTRSTAISFSDTPTVAYGFTLGSDCDYDLDIDISAPCPPITPTTTTNIDVTYGAGTLSYYFNKTAGCNYALNMSLNVPCPAISPTTTRSTTVPFIDSSVGSTDYYFAYTTGCNYDLRINVTAPCPTIGPLYSLADEIDVPLDETDTPYGKLKFGFDYSVGCEYELRIDLKTGCMPVLPLVPTDFTDFTFSKDTPKLTYRFESGEGSCTKTIKFDGFALPCIPNPTLTAEVHTSSPGTDPVLDFSVDTDSECNQEWYFDLTIPMGAQGAQGEQGEGPPGAQGDMGPQGFQGDKFAIVPYKDRFIGLACTEMGEPRFEEVMTIAIPDDTCVVTAEIDDRFMQSVEDGSIVAVGYTVTHPIRVGIVVTDNVIKIRVGPDSLVKDVAVTVKLSGIRRGHDWRFKEFSAQEAQNNLRFWDSWRRQGAIDFTSY